MKLLLISAAMLTPAYAAFIVEASGGLGNANFSFGGDTTTASISTPSSAVGLTGASLFGGDGSASGDTYIFSYTPGSDVDNFSPTVGSLLGSTTGFGTSTASGAAGGGSGLYNVYWTTPASTNVNVNGSNFTITSDGADIVNPIDGNNGGTGPDLDPGMAFVGGANNAWQFLATVELTAGQTYTVTQVADTNSFVSMRSHAIMWEAADAVPEPSTSIIALLSGLAFLGRRRR